MAGGNQYEGASASEVRIAAASVKWTLTEQSDSPTDSDRQTT